MKTQLRKPSAGKSQRFQNYAGTLRDIRIYNRALGAGEIAGR